MPRRPTCSALHALLSTDGKSRSPPLVSQHGVADRYSRPTRPNRRNGFAHRHRVGRDYETVLLHPTRIFAEVDTNRGSGDRVDDHPRAIERPVQFGVTFFALKEPCRIWHVSVGAGRQLREASPLLMSGLHLRFPRWHSHVVQQRPGKLGDTDSSPRPRLTSQYAAGRNQIANTGATSHDGDAHFLENRSIFRSAVPSSAFARNLGDDGLMRLKYTRSFQRHRHRPRERCATRTNLYARSPPISSARCLHRGPLAASFART